MHEDAAGGAAEQGCYVRAVIGGGERGLIGKADAVDETHIHIDDLEALFVAAAAGDHLRLVIHMAGVPQTVGNQRRRAFGRGQFRRGRFTDTGGQFMHYAVFHVDDAAQWPRQSRMQAWAEDLYRLAKTFIDPTALQGHFVHAGQRPAYRQHHQQHRQERPTHVSKRPDLAQVDAKAVVQFMLQREQGLRRPAQQPGDKALRHQPGLEAWLARAEQGQHRS